MSEERAPYNATPYTTDSDSNAPPSDAPQNVQVDVLKWYTTAQGERLIVGVSKRTLQRHASRAASDTARVEVTRQGGRVDYRLSGLYLLEIEAAARHAKERAVVGAPVAVDSGATGDASEVLDAMPPRASDMPRKVTVRQGATRQDNIAIDAMKAHIASLEKQIADQQRQADKDKEEKAKLLELLRREQEISLSRNLPEIIAANNRAMQPADTQNPPVTPESALGPESDKVPAPEPGKQWWQVWKK